MLSRKEKNNYLAPNRNKELQNKNSYPPILTQDYAENQSPQCKYCHSHNLIQQEAPPPHYKKLICGDCGKFIKWLPNPEKEIRLQQQKQLIKKLVVKPLRGWDGTFIRDLYGRRDNLKSLSTKQTAQLNRIAGNFDVEEGA
ncbi:MAG: hypothetical protein QNJ68_07955 [Microcoleaceae cyanobacterium MO_207.B10]|nr:hypothetical protein [Microcoleaceae cyanobacterium MO_207.B10]